MCLHSFENEHGLLLTVGVAKLFSATFLKLCCANHGKCPQIMTLWTVLKLSYLWHLDININKKWTDSVSSLY